MSKIIIGIHGLRNKPSKELLEKWWKKAIRDGLRGIGKYIYKPKIEIVYWADVLHDKPLDEKVNDKNDPYFLDEPYTPPTKNFKTEPHTTRKKFLDFLEKQIDRLFLKEDLSINYSFISDLVIHKYFKELEIYYKNDPIDKNNSHFSAREIIRNKAIELLKNHKKDEIFLIAHSMGSIVAYDVLTLNIPEMKINTFVTMGSPLGLPIVMSKIASEENLRLHKTKKLRTPPGVGKYWYNFSDLKDKVAMNYNLADDYDENEKGIKAVDIIVNNDYEIKGERNPHKLYGYLRTPEFSKVVFEFLIQGRMKPVQWLLNMYNNLYVRLIKFTYSAMKKLNSRLVGEDDES